MSSVFVKTIGQGPNLVMLHGWGFNSNVWQTVVESLSANFTLHLVDLPGFGYSEPLQDYKLPIWAQAIAEVVPSNALWLGWSLGGLVATQAALSSDIKLAGLITLASSPCFEAKSFEAKSVEEKKLNEWPGIDPKTLEQFHQQLKADVKRTRNNFLALQAMGSVSAKADIKQLKLAVDASPEPHFSALDAGLGLLQESDLRQYLHQIKQPWLRLYGRRDGLVPRAVLPIVDELANTGASYLFKHSAHAPFITESELFVSKLVDFYVNNF